MRKPTFFICENKDAAQLRSNCEANQRLCFRYMDSTTLVCFKTDRKPHCWFSHDAAHISIYDHIYLPHIIQLIATDRVWHVQR